MKIGDLVNEKNKVVGKKLRVALLAGAGLLVLSVLGVLWGDLPWIVPAVVGVVLIVGSVLMRSRFGRGGM